MKKKVCMYQQMHIRNKCFIVSFDLIVWIFWIWFRQHPDMVWGFSLCRLASHLEEFTYTFWRSSLPLLITLIIAYLRLISREFLHLMSLSKLYGGPLSASASGSSPSSWCLHRFNRCYAKRRIIRWLLKNERHLYLRDNANSATRLL